MKRLGIDIRNDVSQGVEEEEHHEREDSVTSEYPPFVESIQHPKYDKNYCEQLPIGETVDDVPVAVGPDSVIAAQHDEETGVDGQGGEREESDHHVGLLGARPGVEDEVENHRDARGEGTGRIHLDDGLLHDLLDAVGGAELLVGGGPQGKEDHQRAEQVEARQPVEAGHERLRCSGENQSPGQHGLSEASSG